MTFTYQRSEEAKDYPPVVEFSENLSDWETAVGSGPDANSVHTMFPGIGDTMKIGGTMPKRDKTKLFVRMRGDIP